MKGLRAAVCAGVLMLAGMALGVQCAEKPEAKTAGQDGTWIGQLSAPSGGGDASLKAKEDKKTLVLWAGDDSVKKELADLTKKHANVSVSGTMAPDNINVKVTSVIAQEDKKHGKNK